MQTEGPAALQDVFIPIDGLELRGDLHVPAEALGLVIFAHGSGSSRHSPRNQAVAQKLQQDGLATLLFDLLTEAEEEAERLTREFRFNIPMLSHRLCLATDWTEKREELRHLPIGYFGASTGAAAALKAASKQREKIRAVVSRGGRPDLALTDLSLVQSATLLIVGGKDTAVIGMNQTARDVLECEKFLKIVPGATHLFEETGALETVAELASRWFQIHFR